MAKLPEHKSQTVDAIYRSYERDEPDRAYLGGSIIGTECERSLWYTFRFASKKTFPGRILRLFDTGHREEDRMISDLRRIGVTVWSHNPKTGKQWGFKEASVGNHLAGHADGILTGLPEAPKAPHLLECKTHSEKSFTGLKANGVQAAKPVHWFQCQVYMAWTIEAFGSKNGCHRALYLACNKNTDELYAERIEYDESAAAALIAKAQRVIFAQTPPPRLSDDPSWYECKFCDHHAVCHAGAVPAVSCRTCAHATPERTGDARWTCALNGNNDIPTEHQREAHKCHRFIPPLVEAHFELFDWQAPNTVTWINKATGKHFTQPDWTSAEMYAAQDKRAIGNEEIDVFRQKFGAQVAA